MFLVRNYFELILVYVLTYRLHVTVPVVVLYNMMLLLLVFLLLLLFCFNDFIQLLKWSE